MQPVTIGDRSPIVLRHRNLVQMRPAIVGVTDAVYVVRLDEATAVCEDDQLNTITRAEFGQCAGDVRLDSCF
jgi:hypothetical protein